MNLASLALHLLVFSVPLSVAFLRLVIAHTSMLGRDECCLCGVVLSVQSVYSKAEKETTNLAIGFHVYSSIIQPGHKPGAYLFFPNGPAEVPKSFLRSFFPFMIASTVPFACSRRPL